jgi:hypothetical protein
MKKHDPWFRLGRSALGLALLTFILFDAVPLSWSAGGQKAPAEQMSLLKGPFDLGASRSGQVHYFRQETRFVHIGFDGKRTGAEIYILKLKCLPAAMSGKAGDEYTCREFRLRINDGPELTVPSLAGWSYVFTLQPEGKDEKGQVLGIPHAKFEGLADSRGNKLAVGVAYAVYNNFIDFHSFNDVFARPAAGGPGIQDLKNIGQRIIHAAAFSEPPVNLGAGIKEGSVFRNGEVSLEFKGLSTIDGAACALVGYDSGESTLKMIMPVGPDKDIVTVGGSEYKGDLFIDLATRWVRKVTMDEFVVTETTVPGPAPKIDAYTVRHLLMRMISQEEFEKD